MMKIMMKLVNNKRSIIVLTLLFIMVSMLTFGTVNDLIANAADTNRFDKSYVLDDLEGAMVEGEVFAPGNYPYDKDGEVQLLNFVEYSFAARVNARNHYALYIYIYNPQRLNIATGITSNTIQLASKYDADGKILDYDKYYLKFCSASTDKYDKLFYKFKVVDTDPKNAISIATRVAATPDERKYDMSGIDLSIYGRDNPKTCTIARGYTVTGYAKGYGVDTTADSTLACAYQKIETIELKVKPTNYKTGYTGTAYSGYQTDINSVYFDIDNEIIANYGTLYGIESHYFAYQTPYMLVIDDTELYNQLLPYQGAIVRRSVIKECSKSDGTFDPAPLRDALKDKGFDVPSTFLSLKNLRFYYYLYVSGQGLGDEAVLAPALFYTKGVPGKNYSVSSQDLKEYIDGYNKSYHYGKRYIGERTFSADLLTENKYFGVDIEGIKLGEVPNKVKVSDNFKIKIGDIAKVKPNDGLYTKMFKTFYDVPQGTSRPAISPIETLTTKELQKSGAYDTYLINNKDLATVQDDVRAAEYADKTTYIYHFSITPYITNQFQNLIGSDPKGYAASQAVIYDFQIIQLTFDKDGELTIIPVAQSPIDIINAIVDPPYSGENHTLSAIADFFKKVGDWFKSLGDWFKTNGKWILVAIGAIILVVIACCIIKAIAPGRRNGVNIHMISDSGAKASKAPRSAKNIKKSKPLKKPSKAKPKPKTKAKPKSQVKKYTPKKYMR